MRLALLDLEERAGDQVGDHLAELGARAGSAPPEHQRRRGDLRQPVGGVVFGQRVQEALQVLGRLLVRKGEHVVDERGDGPVLVRPGGVDVEVEALEEGARAGGDVDQPLHERTQER